MLDWDNGEISIKKLVLDWDNGAITTTELV